MPPFPGVLPREILQVRLILGPPAGALIDPQIFDSNEVNGNRVVKYLHSTGPGRGKVAARNPVKNFKEKWTRAEMGDYFWIKQLVPLSRVAQRTVARCRFLIGLKAKGSNDDLRRR